MADTQNQGVQPSNNVPMQEKSRLTTGRHTIFSVRPFTKNVVINGVPTSRPMWAFNVTPSSAGFYLSHSQLLAAGVEEPGLLQDTEMFVEFFQPGEVLLSGAEVRDDGVIVKNFVPSLDKDLLRQVAVQKMISKSAAMDAAAAASRTPRNVVRNTTAPTGDQPDAGLAPQGVGTEASELTNESLGG